MADVVIFGAGDIAKLAHVYLTTDSPHAVVAFAVDSQFRTADTFRGLPLVDFESLPARYPAADYSMFIAMAYRRMNHDRAGAYERAKALGYTLVSYVSSRCTFLTDEPTGDNCFILEDNTVQPFVKIGSNVTLWSGNHIGHDAVIEDHCFISSHVVVSGHVRVGSYSFVGVNATLRNGISIAPRTLIGAGAVIMKDTIPKGVYLAPRAELFAKNSDKIDP